MKEKIDISISRDPLKKLLQTFERQTKLIHYVNCYAVRDCVNLSSCSTEAYTGDMAVTVESLLSNDTE